VLLGQPGRNGTGFSVRRFLFCWVSFFCFRITVMIGMSKLKHTAMELRNGNSCKIGGLIEKVIYHCTLRP
jgi:hypothetical protein